MEPTARLWRLRAAAHRETLASSLRPSASDGTPPVSAGLKRFARLSVVASDVRRRATLVQPDTSTVGHRQYNGA
jgi:hypothetical protein